MPNEIENDFAESGADVVSEAAATYGIRPRMKRRIELLPGTSIPRHMSEDEYVDWIFKEENHSLKAEWVAGEVVLLMADNVEHHDIEFMIAKILSEFCLYKNLGRVFHSRIQVRLPVKPSRREPDILFVPKSKESLIQKTYINGAPALAMEVVSPSSGVNDYRIKFEEYQEAGIREYWLIDPALRALTIYALNLSGCYEKVTVQNGKYESFAVPGFYIRQEWLDNPNAVRLFDALKEMGAF